MSRRLLIAGAVSGAVWFLLALAFDKGVRDFNWPVIPVSNALELTASLLAAIATGLGVAVLFYPVWHSRSRTTLFVAPIVALPLAVLGFSLLAWLFNQTVGAETNSLNDIIMNLLSYATVSVFMPILYVLTVLNGLVLRRVVAGAA
jgi:hypothetical protein